MPYHIICHLIPSLFIPFHPILYYLIPSHYVSSHFILFDLLDLKATEFTEKKLPLKYNNHNLRCHKYAHQVLQFCI